VETQVAAGLTMGDDDEGGVPEDAITVVEMPEQDDDNANVAMRRSRSRRSRSRSGRSLSSSSSSSSMGDGDIGVESSVGAAAAAAVGSRGVAGGDDDTSIPVQEEHRSERQPSSGGVRGWYDTLCACGSWVASYFRWLIPTTSFSFSF